MADIRKLAESLINGTAKELEDLQKWYDIEPLQDGQYMRRERRKEIRFNAFNKKKK